MNKEHSLQFLGFGKNSTIELDLWDVAGQEEFDRLRPLSYREADVFMLCFDITNKTSLGNIETKWLCELAHHYKSTKNAKVMLAATKCDKKTDRDGNAVTIIEADTVSDFIWRIKSNKSFKQLFSHQMDIPYIETSAHKNSNVVRAFEIAIILGFRQIDTYWLMRNYKSSNCLGTCSCCCCRCCCGGNSGVCKFLSYIGNICCLSCCFKCCCGYVQCNCNCCTVCTCMRSNCNAYDWRYTWITVRIIGKGGEENKKEVINCGKEGYPDCDHKECKKYIITDKAEIDDNVSDKMVHPLVVQTAAKTRVILASCISDDSDDDHNIAKYKAQEWMRFINDYKIDWDDICPLRFDWEKQRIIWIGYCKNSQNKQCLLGKLPKDMITTILSFLR